MYDRNNPAELERVEKVVYDMVDRALDMDGSCTVGGLNICQWLNLELEPPIANGRRASTALAWARRSP